MKTCLSLFNTAVLLNCSWKHFISKIIYENKADENVIIIITIISDANSLCKIGNELLTLLKVMLNPVIKMVFRLY